MPLVWELLHGGGEECAGGRGTASGGWDWTVWGAESTGREGRKGMTFHSGPAWDLQASLSQDANSTRSGLGREGIH